MKRFAVLAVVVVAGLTVLVGCGGGSSHGAVAGPTASPSPSSSTSTPASDSSSGRVPEACTLLSPADVQTAFGGTVSGGQSTVDQASGQSICNWTVTQSDGSGFGVELDIHTNQAAGDFDRQRQVAQGKTATVTGLGDGAFTEVTNQDSFTFTDLWVRHATTAFRVEVLKDSPPDPLESLAHTVLAKV